MNDNYKIFGEFLLERLKGCEESHYYSGRENTLFCVLYAFETEYKIRFDRGLWLHELLDEDQKYIPFDDTQIICIFTNFTDPSWKIPAGRRVYEELHNLYELSHVLAQHYPLRFTDFINLDNAALTLSAELAQSTTLFALINAKKPQSDAAKDNATKKRDKTGAAILEGFKYYGSKWCDPNPANNIEKGFHIRAGSPYIEAKGDGKK